MVRGKRYTQEFKDSAIQLALNSEESVRKIAKDLEIHEKTLYGWLSDYRKKHNLEVLNPISKKFSSIESIEEENKNSLKEVKKIESLHLQDEQMPELNSFELKSREVEEKTYISRIINLKIKKIEKKLNNLINRIIEKAENPALTELFAKFKKQTEEPKP